MTSRTTLREAPPGLFVFERDGRRSLGFKTEYHTPDGRTEAYVVASGEFFYGGAASYEDRENLIVRPISEPGLIVGNPEVVMLSSLI